LAKRKKTSDGTVRKDGTVVSQYSRTGKPYVPYKSDPKRKLKNPKAHPRTDDPRRCKGKRKDGVRCRRFATPGKDLCRIHGGASTGPGKKNAGKSSKYHVGFFGDLLREFDGTDWNNLKDETAVLRALVLQFVRHISEGGLEDEEKVERLIYNADKVTGIIDKLGKLVERFDRMENGTQTTLNIRQVAAMSQQIVDIINEEVADPEARRRIAERLEGLVVPIR